MAILSKHLECWDKIETPFYIKKWISEGVTIPFISEPSPIELENYVTDSEQEQFIDTKLTEYLSENYISEVQDKPDCVSPIGCASKKGSEKYRVITDMRYVNSYIDIPSVRYEDLSVLPNVVRNNDSYASVDLKDGFNNITLRRDFRKYFGFGKMVKREQCCSRRAAYGGSRETGARQISSPYCRVAHCSLPQLTCKIG